MRPWLALALLLVLFLSGCAGTTSPTTTDTGSSSASASSSTTSAAPQGHAVSIIDFGFTPKVLNITAGDSVTWTNTGSRVHTASSYSSIDGFDSGGLAPGGTFTHTFTVPGKSYNYHCKIHANMIATINVQ